MHTVLVVEHDQTFRAAAERALRQAGFAVHCVADGRAAIAAMNGSNSFGLLVADIRSPQVDLAIMSRVARGRKPPVKLLLLTGSEQSTDASRADHASVRGLANPDVLVSQVRLAFDRP